jgi:hypothetical protein
MRKTIYCWVDVATSRRESLKQWARGNFNCLGRCPLSQALALPAKRSFEQRRGMVREENSRQGTFRPNEVPQREYLPAAVVRNYLEGVDC